MCELPPISVLTMELNFQRKWNDKTSFPKLHVFLKPSQLAVIFVASNVSYIINYKDEKQVKASKWLLYAIMLVKNIKSDDVSWH